MSLSLVSVNCVKSCCKIHQLVVSLHLSLTNTKSRSWQQRLQFAWTASKDIVRLVLESVMPVGGVLHVCITQGSRARPASLTPRRAVPAALCSGDTPSKTTTSSSNQSPTSSSMHDFAASTTCRAVGGNKDLAKVLCRTAWTYTETSSPHRTIASPSSASAVSRRTAAQCAHLCEKAGNKCVIPWRRSDARRAMQRRNKHTRTAHENMSTAAVARQRALHKRSMASVES